jgi:hypothetical protein
MSPVKADPFANDLAFLGGFLLFFEIAKYVVRKVWLNRKAQANDESWERFSVSLIHKLTAGVEIEDEFGDDTRVQMPEAARKELSKALDTAAGPFMFADLSKVGSGAHYEEWEPERRRDFCRFLERGREVSEGVWTGKSLAPTSQ